MAARLRSTSSSAVTSRIIGSSSSVVSSRNTSSSEARCDASSATSMPAPTRARLSAGGADGSRGDGERAVAAIDRIDARLRGRGCGQRRRSARRARAAGGGRAARSTVPSATSAPSRMTPTRSADLLDLAHQVAGEHDRALALAERTDEPAHVGHPGGVEAVGGLVEDQQLGVLEQRGGDAEALLHAQRVGARTVARAIASSTCSSTVADAVLGDPGVTGQDPEVVAPREVGVERGRLDHRADPRQPGRRAGQLPSTVACPRRSGGRGRAASAGWWSCRRRWGRGSRTPRRAARAGRARRRR